MLTNDDSGSAHPEKMPRGLGKGEENVAIVKYTASGWGAHPCSMILV